MNLTLCRPVGLEAEATTPTLLAPGRGSHAAPEILLMNSAKRTCPVSARGGSEQVSGIPFVKTGSSKVNIPPSPSERRQAEEVESGGEMMTSGGEERENLSLHRLGMQTGIPPPRGGDNHHQFPLINHIIMVWCSLKSPD